MSALRKAGVWLGLVEEEDGPHEEGFFDDEFGEDDSDFAPSQRPRSLTRPSPRSGDREVRSTERDQHPDRGSAPGRIAERDQRASDLRTGDRNARTTDPVSRTSERTADATRAERASVRQLARPGASSTASFPTHDNLALAPQVQLRERAVVSDDKSRRYQITTLHPTTYNEARTIGEHFRNGYPVIMSLTEMDEPDAKRLVDFAAGLAFGLRGSMERVTNRVFLLSPPNIQVSAEDKARIAEGGFVDQV